MQFTYYPATIFWLKLQIIFFPIDFRHDKSVHNGVIKNFVKLFCTSSFLSLPTLIRNLHNRFKLIPLCGPSGTDYTKSGHRHLPKKAVVARSRVSFSSFESIKLCQFKSARVHRLLMYYSYSVFEITSNLLSRYTSSGLIGRLWIAGKLFKLYLARLEFLLNCHFG